MAVDLRTRYLNFELPHPIMVGACPLTENLDRLRELEQAGAAAAVFPSLFEEQIEHEEMGLHHLHESSSDSFPEALNYFPKLDRYNVGPEPYLARIADAKRAVSIPIIASLNGITHGGWIRYARRIEEAGADALELNIALIAAAPGTTAEEVEQRYLDLVAEVRQVVSIPLSVKIGPFFSALTNMALRLVAAGADGLTLFNRFVHPDIDLDTLSLVPDLPLSRSSELRLPLSWIAILRQHVPVSLAASSGVHTAADVLKVLLAGADAVMVVSALYKEGPDELHRLIRGMQQWLEERGYESVEQMKGSMARHNCANPEGYERINYMRTLTGVSRRPLQTRR